MARRRASGEGTIRKRAFKRKDGSSYTRWFARITIAWDGSKQRWRDGPLRVKEKEALEDLKAMQKELASGGFSNDANQTLEQYLTAWLRQVALSKKYGTYRSYEPSVRLHIVPILGHLLLKKLRRTDVQNMINKVFEDAKAKGKDGAATTRKARAALRKALQDAIDLELLPGDRRNPCERVTVPSEKIKAIEPWSTEASKQFLDIVSGDRLYPLLYTALTTGMWEGELCGLKWDDLETVEETEGGSTALYLRINIHRTLVVVPTRYEAAVSRKLEHVTGRYYFDEPKTKGSKNSVLVGADTLEVLTEHRANLEAKAHRLGSRWQEFGLVFPASTGVPQSPRNLLRDYKALIAKAKVPELSFHDLRDTHASRLLAAGVDIGAVSERLRHSRKSTTLDRYVHTMPLSRRKSAVVMENLLKKGA